MGHTSALIFTGLDCLSCRSLHRRYSSTLTPGCRLRMVCGASMAWMAGGGLLWFRDKMQMDAWQGRRMRTATTTKWQAELCWMQLEVRMDQGAGTCGHCVPAAGPADWLLGSCEA